MDRYAIGIDFGTESARAILVNIASGEVAASEMAAYPDGVIDERLPIGNILLPPNYALQNPLDWLRTMQSTVQTVIKQAGIQPNQIIGIGVDFTSCTILPTTTS